MVSSSLDWPLIRVHGVPSLKLILMMIILIIIEANYELSFFNLIIIEADYELFFSFNLIMIEADYELFSMEYKLNFWKKGHVLHFASTVVGSLVCL